MFHSLESLDSVVESINSGETKYGIMLPDQSLPKEVRLVNTLGQFDANIKFICDYIENTLMRKICLSLKKEEESSDKEEEGKEEENEENEEEENEADENDEENEDDQQSIYHMYIGSTGVMKRSGVNFDTADPHTWKMSGAGTLSHRFHSTHKKLGNTVIAIMCLGSSDIPKQLAAHRQDQRHLSLCYESAISQEMRRRIKVKKNGVWKFQGSCDAGGKMSNVAKAGHVVYCAIRKSIK